MDQGTQVVWRDGVLRDVTKADERARVALASLSCPLAYSRLSEVGAAIAADELAWAATMLGHGIATRSELLNTVIAAVSGCEADVVALALVPTTLPSSALAQWNHSDLVAWPVLPPANPIAAALFDAPLNEHGAAVSLRVTGDSEEGVSRRWAMQHGADIAIRRNLAGNVSRVGPWSVVVESESGLVSPGLSDGAPYDGWRRALADRGEITEASVSVDMVRGSTACIAGWGTAYSVVVTPGVSSGALADHLNTRLQSLESDD